MPEFCATTTLDHSQSSVFQYHDNPGAIDRLIPPWENVRIAKRSDSLEIGSEVELVQRLMGMRQSWLARHIGLERGRWFVDSQIRGPFAKWIHRHEFASIDEYSSALTDRIEYELPLAPFSSVADGWVRSKLAAMFAYRHRITRDDLDALRRLESRIQSLGRVPRIAVAGSSGLVGRRVVELASVWGWDVIRIVRPDSRPDAVPFPRTVRSVVWDPKTSAMPDSLGGVDAVMQLAGQGIADKRWNGAVKRQIWASRVDFNARLVEGLQSLASPPARFVSASGVGIFGDAGDRICEEEDAPGRGFLAELAVAWEGAAQAYATSAQSVVQARLGVVLHPRAGALSKLLFPARWGLGGPIGSGRQYWPWVHIDDAANILLHLAIASDARGPYHVVAPQIVTQREFASTLGRVLHRPSWLPLPAWVLKLGLGEMAQEMLLASARVATPRLVASGYRFRFPDLDSALRHLLGRFEGSI